MPPRSPEERASSEGEGGACSSSDEKEERGVKWDPQLVRCKESPERSGGDDPVGRGRGTGMSWKEMERKPLVRK